MMATVTASAVIICPVLPHPPVTGARKRTLRLLEAMAGAGVTPHLVTADAAGAAAAPALRERGWAVDVLDEPPQGLRDRARQHLARRPSPYLRSVARRLRELPAGGPAFVQAEHAMSSYYVQSHPARPWVLSLHNVDSELLAGVARGERPLTPAWPAAWNRVRSMRATERRAVPAADAVLCVSEHDAAACERLGGRVLHVPNGVDDELFAISPELPAGERVLFFGDLSYAPNGHGLRRFLREGWPRLAAARPGAELRVVGPGLDAALARELDATPRARAAGLVEDITAELAASRLAIVPIWQGGGTRLKVLEALAAARPVVGTPLGVAGVGFRPDREGLVAARPADLADAAAALLGDGDRAAALAASGRRLADGYRWSRVTAPAAELYARWAA